MSSPFRHSLIFGLFSLVSFAGFASLQAEPAVIRLQQIKIATLLALNGKTYEAQIAGNKFKVRPATVKTTLLGTTITGQIDHVRNLLPDEVMVYSIRKYRDKVVSMQIRILRTGNNLYTPKYTSLILNRNFYPASAEDSLIAFLASRLDSNWQSAAELIAVSIALKAKDPSGIRIPQPQGQLVVAKPPVNTQK